MHNYLKQFQDEIRKSGMTPPIFIAPGKFYRFPGINKKSINNKSGWCILFENQLGGVFGDFSSSLFKGYWRADKERPFTKKEQDSIDRNQIIVMEKINRLQDKARRHAEFRWKNFSKGSVSHPYLDLKGIKSYGIRIDKNERIMVPVCDSNQMHSLQLIDKHGGKRFLTGGRVKGCYHTIGVLKEGSTICICEGYATGATIHEATSYPVIVAFHAGNLLPVALTVKKLSPLSIFLICADDDFMREGNPGIAKANEAARAVNGSVITPKFPENRTKEMTDFNDMRKFSGLNAVRSCILQEDEQC